MIVFLIAALGSLIAIATLPGTVELAMLTLGAVLGPRRRQPRQVAGHLRLAVVVPAHNEEGQIEPCVKSVLGADRTELDLTVVVIADNCKDRTAAVARAAGASVLERTNLQQRGKGYALDFAFTQLRAENFDAFLVIDADSVISGNLLVAIAQQIREGADAVQCRYVVRNPGDSARTRLMNVALLAFNVMRPRGRDHFGLSAGIYGNGFALTAETLAAVPYEASSVVEDLEYHLNLVRAGRKVRFADSTAVYGDMPASGKGVSTQRTRWEGGRFRMLAERGPALAREVLRGRLAFLEPLLDLLLLPLAFHVSLLLAALCTPFAPARDLALTGLAVVAFHLIATIAICGTGWRDFGILATAPFYVLWKLLMLPSLLKSAKAGTSWVRTERVSEEHPR